MISNKVTVVTERLYPDENSTSYFMTEITHAISDANGGDINVICAGGLNGYDELPFLKNKIIRLTNSKLSKNNYFSRIFRVSILAFRLGWHTLFTIKKGDRLFTHTLEPLVLIIAIIRKFKNFEYILLVYDVFPENLIAANVLKKESLIYKVLKFFFDWAYSQTDHLVVIGRDMQELIEKKTEGAIPISLITNWCDIDKVKVQLKNENQIIKNFNLEHKVVFSFVGNLGRVQGIDLLLKVASLVKNPDFVLLFIGDGASVPSINKYIENSNNKNVMYAGHFPFSENNLVLNACDVAIVSLNKSMYGLGVPSKSYNNMAAMKPILYIGDSNSEIGQVVVENNIGWVCDEIHASEVARRIELIIDEKKEIKIFGSNARSLAQREYSKKNILNKYMSLFS
jgi:glycosyltransferase involved in cell wall biosynthesis